MFADALLSHTHVHTHMYAYFGQGYHLSIQSLRGMEFVLVCRLDVIPISEIGTI